MANELPSHPSPTDEGSDRHVLVIGAGLSGLVALKELAAAGFNPVCCDPAPEIGGVFTEQASYDPLRLTVSNYFMAYSDFMPFDEDIRFWTRAEYKAYLDRYATHFDLMRRIRLRTRVLSIEPDGSGWRVALMNGREETAYEHFTHVAVCTGQFQTARIPNIPGLEGFPGTKFHSSRYRGSADLEQFRGQRVLCIGLGESGADVSADVAEVAESVTVAIRRYHSVAPRVLNGLPIDVSQTRHWHSLSASHKSDSLRRQWRWAATNGASDDALSLLAAHFIRSGDEAGSVVTKTERAFEAQATGRLDFRIASVERFEQSEAVFDDGHRAAFDAVLLCTGYRLSIPFLPTSLTFEDVRDCYLHMFKPGVSSSLAFVGFVRPQQGGIPLMAELQSRYLALVWAGKRCLPDDLEAAACADAEEWRSEFYETPEVAGLVNGLRYNERMAQRIGCAPPIPSMLTSPKRFFKYWFAHVWPCQYRIVGPDAHPAAARWVEAPSRTTLRHQLAYHLPRMAYEWTLRRLAPGHRHAARPIRLPANASRG